jgi:hypothetical protein
MPTYIWELGTFEQGLKVPVYDVLGVEGGAFACGEYEPRIFV